MFGSSNSFDPNKDIPDLSGKVFVVTGGSAGIGDAYADTNLQSMLTVRARLRHLRPSAPAQLRKALSSGQERRGALLHESLLLKAVQYADLLSWGSTSKKLKRD